MAVCTRSYELDLASPCCSIGLLTGSLHQHFVAIIYCIGTREVALLNVFLSNKIRCLMVV